MLLKQTHYPLGNSNGKNWGTVIVIMILIVGVGIIAYGAMQQETIILQPKKRENERL